MPGSRNKSNQSSRPPSIEDLKKVLFTKDDAKEMELRINGRTDGMERQLGGISERASAVEFRLSNVEVKVERIEQKLEHLGKGVSHIVFKEHAPILKDHEQRIKKLETASSLP